MSKKLKDKISYAGIFIFIFILPHLFLYFMGRDNNKIFYERVNEDHRICLERAGRDGVDARWCDQIRSASVHNYHSTNTSQNIFPLLLYYSPLLFVLLITTGKLRRQVEELKEKLDV